jgi:hypothetical protein
VDIYVVPHGGSGHNNAMGFLPGEAEKIVICSIDTRRTNARKFGLSHKAAMEQFEAAMPKKMAPNHRVVYWTGKAKAREKRDTPEVECRCSRSPDPSSNTAGIALGRQHPVPAWGRRRHCDRHHGMEGGRSRCAWHIADPADRTSAPVLMIIRI